MEESKLSEQCKVGDNRARRVLYEQFAGRMLAISIRYIGERDLAEDIVQDAFVKILGSFDKFTYRGKGSLKAWIDRIIVNTALDYLRNNKKNKVLWEHEVGDRVYAKAAADLRDETEDIEYEPCREEQMHNVPPQVLLQFISELPVGYRTVFNLYVFEEKSHKEIAGILGINEKSSSSQLYRAKCTLAKMINGYIQNRNEERG